ncbi:MAG: hypothetical protein ACK504_10430 [Bacteroidota bacterium]
MKSKTLKIATLLILFTLSSLNLLSQNLIYDKDFALKQIQASTSLIFEGKILSKGKSFRGKDHRIYTPYETQVDKIIYGKKTSSTINIIMDGGNIEENGSYFGTDVEDGLQIKLNNTSVIFCTPFTFGNLPSAYMLTSQVVYDANNEIIVRNGLAEYYENKNVNDLFKDLSKQFNIRIPQKKSPIVSQNTKISKINADSVATHNANYNKHINFFTSKYNNRRSQKINQVLANNLIISTGNELITYAGSTRFLEFDVLAKANTSGLYFDNCLIRLKMVA